MCLSELGSAYLINHITYCKLFLFLYMTGNYSFPGSLYYVPLTNLLYNSSTNIVILLLPNTLTVISHISYRYKLMLAFCDQCCWYNSAEGLILNPKLTCIHTQFVIIIFTLNALQVSSSPGVVCNNCALQILVLLISGW